jgi:hypothetical protein
MIAVDTVDVIIKNVKISEVYLVLDKNSKTIKRKNAPIKNKIKSPFVNKGIFLIRYISYVFLSSITIVTNTKLVK